MALAYTYIRRNEIRSALFVVLFALSLLSFTYFAVYGFFVLKGVLAYFRPTGFLTFHSTLAYAFSRSLDICRWLFPFCIAVSIFWARLAIKEGAEFILARVRGVQPLLKFEAYDAYTVLENLCVRTGDIVPRLYVLQDSSMNAFSVGAVPKDAAIVLSSGLLEKLSRVQLEGVLAHELAHIRNLDVRLMTILVTCLAFFTFVGEYFFYGTEKDAIYEQSRIDFREISRPMGPLAYIGLMLMVYGYLVAPLIRLGLSRTRESLADAQAALTTRYPRGLASALWKISGDCQLETLENSTLLGVLCIVSPFSDKPSLFNRLSGLTRSHPPVEERIRALNDMDGMFSDFSS